MLRRGSENMEKMTTKTFQLDYNQESAICFVKKVIDEVTKNHQETNNEVITGFMPQIMDTSTGMPHKMCPL